MRLHGYAVPSTLMSFGHLICIITRQLYHGNSVVCEYLPSEYPPLASQSVKICLVTELLFLSSSDPVNGQTCLPGLAALIPQSSRLPNTAFSSCSPEV